MIDDYKINSSEDVKGLLIGLLIDIVKIIFFGALAIELIFN